MKTDYLEGSMFQRALEIMLICVALGVVFGLSRAVAECWQNDYVSLGFWRSIFIEVRGKTIQTGTVGGAIGVIFALFVFLNRIFSRLELPVLSHLCEVIRKAGKGAWPYLICLFCALVCLAIRSSIQKLGNGPVATFSIVIGAILWSILFTVFKNKNTNGQNHSWYESKLLRKGFYTISVLFVLAFVFLDKQLLKEYVSVEIIVTGSLTIGMVVLGVV